MDPEILLIGEALIDIVRRPSQEPQFCPGGSPMNVAIGLGRLGHHPTLATWFGKDEFGRTIADHCQASGVSILEGSDAAPRTPTADARLDEAGHATYVFDIDLQMPAIPDDLHPMLVHTGSIGALVPPMATDVLAYVEASEAFVTFDPNCRPSIMGAPDEVRSLVERYVQAANLVKVSDEDLEWLYPQMSDLEDQARRWLDLGPKIVVVTMGSRGAVAVAKDWAITIPADTSPGLADTVGAGDSFMTGLIHGVLKHERPSDLAETPQIFESILTQAAIMSGITVSRAGANPPWLAELGVDNETR